MRTAFQLVIQEILKNAINNNGGDSYDSNETKRHVLVEYRSVSSFLQLGYYHNMI